MEYNEEIKEIKAFTCKHILYHAFIIIIYKNEALYMDNVPYKTCKPNKMVVLHGLTKNHAMRKAEKYLRKRNLISKED